MNWEKFVTTVIFFRQSLEAPPCLSIDEVSWTSETEIVFLL